MVGTEGNYQYILTIIMILQYIIASFVFMSPTFFLIEPRFYCDSEPGREFTEYDGGCNKGC
jgi:hypothetical protein